MSISSSMNAGVSGLQANSNRLATISDNIANSATIGYRRSQTSFHSMVIGGGISGQTTYTAGGVRTTTTRLVDQGGALVGTQNATDIAVSGRGFLPVTTELGGRLTDGTAPLLLSTTGSFRKDAMGLLRDTSGHVLLGWPVNADGTMPTAAQDSTSGLRPVRIDAAQQLSVPTSRVTLAVNLPAAATLPSGSGDPVVMSLDYFNGVGLSEKLTFRFIPEIDPSSVTNRWSLEIVEDATGAVVGAFEVQFNPGPQNGGTLQSVTRTSPTGTDYDPATGSVGIEIGGQPIRLELGALGAATGMVQRGTTFSPIGIEQDGFGFGNMVGLMVSSEGNLDAVYDQGFRRTLFRIPLVDVPNPNGLTALPNQAFQVSRDSGPFFLWNAGTGPVGKFVGFALQESATDVAAELTSLIQTQRAYSSNAKVIQTVDEMFQETTNIKR